MSSKWAGVKSVQNFQEYLRIKSVHPDIDYSECVLFLKKQAESLGLPVKVIEPVAKKPAVIITWAGTDPGLPSIMLNSHMDVVPVSEEHWTHPPFKAHIAEDGWIYARGAQDMKSVGIQHLEAIRRIKENGVRLKRTVHIVFIADEEIGSYDGMRVFVETEDFKDMNVGFGLDESMPSYKENEIIAFYGERTMIQFKIICTAEPGHASKMDSNTAGEKFHYVIDKLMKMRQDQKRILEEEKIWFGEITSINLTQVEGGVQPNVLPESLTAIFDVRLKPELSVEEFTETVTKWCKEAGEGVHLEFIVSNRTVKNTVIDNSNHYWTALKKATDSMGIIVKALICPGATDARLLRYKGVSAIGFSPLLECPILLHAHDERIHIEKHFLRGIDVFEKVVLAIANV